MTKRRFGFWIVFAAILGSRPGLEARAQFTPLRVNKASVTTPGGADGDSGFDAGSSMFNPQDRTQTAMATSSLTGRTFIAFTSLATNLDTSTPDNNNTTDVYLYEPPYQSSILISFTTTSTGRTSANATSSAPAITTDGSEVAFQSDASDLASNDTNGCTDIFMYSHQTIIPVSVDATGVFGNGSSSNPSIRKDYSTGRVDVVFESYANNLASVGSSGHRQILMKNMQNPFGVTLISADNSGNPADADCYSPSISSDGKYVAFSSAATNLGIINPPNGYQQVYVRDVAAGTTIPVSLNNAGVRLNRHSVCPSVASFNPTGTPLVYVAFTTDATNFSLDTNGFSDVYLRDVTNSVTSVASKVVGSSAQSNGYSMGAMISENGMNTIFYSSASNLVSGDTNGKWDVFVYDRINQTMTRASTSPTYQEANADCALPAFTADGITYAFTTLASNLVPNDMDGYWDVFYSKIRGAQDAKWQNYDTGLAGTLGIPTITSSADPIYGTTITISVSNSKTNVPGTFASGYLLTGLSTALTPYLGGTIDVTYYSIVGVTIPDTGLSFSATLTDPALFGLTVYEQVLEVDPGAVQGMSFTPGLKLVMGDY